MWEAWERVEELVWKKNQEEWEKRKVSSGKKAVISEKEKRREQKEGNNILLERACLFLLSSSFHSKHHLWSPYPNHLIFLHSAMTSLDKLLCYHHGTSDKPFGLVTEVWNIPPHTHQRDNHLQKRKLFLLLGAVKNINPSDSRKEYLSPVPQFTSFTFLISIPVSLEGIRVFLTLSWPGTHYSYSDLCCKYFQA